MNGNEVLLKRVNDWSYLTGDQWLAMALILAGSALFVIWLEWVSKGGRK